MCYLAQGKRYRASWQALVDTVHCTPGAARVVYASGYAENFAANLVGVSYSQVKHLQEQS